MKHLQRNTTKDLTEGSLARNLILFAIPLVLGGILSQAFHLLDLIIAGQFLGEKGLAAVGATSSLMTFYFSIFWGFGCGVGIYVANLFGGRKITDIRHAIRTNLCFLFFAGLLLSGILLLFREGLLDLLQVKSEIRQEAMLYFAIALAGGILPVMNTAGLYILNALGCSAFPFLASLLVAVCNVVGNILTVTVWNMGVAGLAVSTLFSSAIGLLFYLIRIHLCLRSLGLDREPFRLNPGSLTAAFRYSLTNMAQQMVMYTAGTLISGIVNGISVNATAAYAVVSQVYNVNANVYQNSAKAVSNYVAQCEGAGKRRQIPRGLRFGALQGALFLALPLLISCVWGGPVCGLFFREGASPEAFSLAVRFTAVYLPFLGLNMINNLFHAFFRGIGSRFWLFVSTALGAIVRTAATFPLAAAMGMEGVYLGWVMSWAAEAVLSLCAYFFAYRKKLLSAPVMCKV